MTPEGLKSDICRTFCAGLSVSTVPAGFAVSTAFIMPDGDPLTFYVVETEDGWVLEDDGDFLATTIASGIPIDTGTRRNLLEGILSECSSSWDRDSFQIRSFPVAEDKIKHACISFAAALVRTRDLVHLTQEAVASTFAEDLRDSVASKLRGQFEVEDDDKTDNPADFILKDARTGLRAASIFAANSNEKLVVALLRHKERHPDDAPVIAVLEKEPGKSVSNKRFMMAQNRGLLMPFYGPDPESAIEFIRDHARKVAA